jgi:hypothetical protein
MWLAWLGLYSEILCMTVKAGYTNTYWSRRTKQEKRDWFKLHHGRRSTLPQNHTRSAATVDALINLYNNPGTPGEKQAVEHRMREMGIPIPGEPVASDDSNANYDDLPNLSMYEVAQNYFLEIRGMSITYRMIQLTLHVERLSIATGKSEAEVWRELESI